MQQSQQTQWWLRLGVWTKGATGQQGLDGGSLPVEWQLYSSSRWEGSIVMVVGVSAVLDHITIYVEGVEERPDSAAADLGGTSPGSSVLHACSRQSSTNSLNKRFLHTTQLLSMTAVLQEDRAIFGGKVFSCTLCNCKAPNNDYQVVSCKCVRWLCASADKRTIRTTQL